MGTPRRVSDLVVSVGTRLVLAACFVTTSGVAGGVAAAQALHDLSSTHRVTQIAAATTGTIDGLVLDERGQPLAGVVVSAMGSSTSVAISDRVGQFSLRALTPGPYLVRAHLDGYIPTRNTMVNVRPSARTVSTFTLRRAGGPDAPRVTTAGVGAADVEAVPVSGRDESETAWRLRHLKRSILRDAATFADLPADDGDFFLAESLQLIGRAFESSARMAGAFFTESPLQGQVNLMTTGVFDDPGQLFQPERTRGVAFFSLGAPVGGHGDWIVKAAVNQGDLSSWILAGNYVARAPARHRYQFGMSYGVHRYEGGNLAAIAAMSESARNVGAVYARDEWSVSDRFSIGYGAHYAHYDYLLQPAYLSPRLSLTYQHPQDRTRIRAVAARHVVAPGAEEFLPPAQAQVLPPQRTFGPLTRAGFAPEDLRHYEVAVEQSVDGATIGVRAFYQSVDEQLVTVFGLSDSDAGNVEVGHYSVGSGGDVDLRGLGVTFSHALMSNVRGSMEYSLAVADWAATPTRDRRRLATTAPSALRVDGERIHDVTTTLETEFPESRTRVFLLYKLNTAYTRADTATPGLGARWNVQVNQGLPFMRFTNAHWEMLVAVHNLFREAFGETSLYDELLVVRPPTRMVGGITVKF